MSKILCTSQLVQVSSIDNIWSYLGRPNHEPAQETPSWHTPAPLVGPNPGAGVRRYAVTRSGPVRHDGAAHTPPVVPRRQLATAAPGQLLVGDPDPGRSDGRWSRLSGCRRPHPRQQFLLGIAARVAEVLAQDLRGPRPPGP